MRVVVLASQWSPDRYSGYARVVGDTARGLVERGHTVTAIVPRRPGHPPLERDGRLLVCRSMRQGLIPITLTDPLETHRGLRRLDPARVDLVLAHSTTSVVALTGAWRSLPLALVFHASGPRELRFNRPHRSRGRRLVSRAIEPLLVAYERVATRRADRILVLSEYSRSLVSGDHHGIGGKIRTLRGGVDTDRLCPATDRDATRARLGLSDRAPTILTVRRLEPRMGLEQLLGATALLLAERPLQLVLAGQGSQREALQRRATELGIGEHVRFLGAISDDELREWYRAADLFVLPTAAYEGFGIATVEALACGLPVVGTAVGATPELLRPLDPRLVCPRPDADALAETIAAALAAVGPELRTRCREYAVSRYSWATVMRDWDAALAELVRGPLAPDPAPAGGGHPPRADGDPSPPSGS